MNTPPPPIPARLAVGNDAPNAATMSYAFDHPRLSTGLHQYRGPRYYKRTTNQEEA